MINFLVEGVTGLAGYFWNGIKDWRKKRQEEKKQRDGGAWCLVLLLVVLMLSSGCGVVDAIQGDEVEAKALTLEEYAVACGEIKREAAPSGDIFDGTAAVVREMERLRPPPEIDRYHTTLMMFANLVVERRSLVDPDVIVLTSLHLEQSDALAPSVIAVLDEHGCWED